MSIIVCRAAPSLALAKYWGKRGRDNIPATTSVAVTLAGLETTTSVRIIAEDDRVTIDGEGAPPSRFVALFDAIRRATRSRVHFDVQSDNNFPTSAGLASSSSGIAALVCACVRATGAELPPERLSALARIGSGSAARAIYGGFTLFPAGAKYARPLFGASHWPALRIVVAIVRSTPKRLGSRDAMELARLTSPLYPAWARSSTRTASAAASAIEQRDIEMLGEAMRHSYLCMFATMLSSSPPLLYWKPESLSILEVCASLRERGIAAWETMDAGPQVKILTTAADSSRLRDAIAGLGATEQIITTEIGPAPRLSIESEEASA